MCQSKDKDINFFEKKMAISFLYNPGIYEILDVKTDISYYGKTNHLLLRCHMHFRQSITNWNSSFYKTFKKL